MRKMYRKLTQDQKYRGVIFSSCLSEDTSESGTIHEVHYADEERHEKIRRLKDDSFFKHSHFNYNIIRR
jgi:hypothetical protein